MKNRNINLNRLIIPAVGVVWIIAFCLFASEPFCGDCYWFGFIIGLLCIIVAEIGIRTMARASRDATEAAVIPIYYTYLFLVFTIGLSAAASFLNSGTAAKVVLVIAILLMIGYAVAVWNAARYVERINRSTAKVKQKISNTRQISSLLASMLVSVENEDIHKALLELKETVDLSGNISKQGHEDLEMSIVQHLRTAQVNMTDGKEPERILKDITEAKKLWMSRNI